MQQRTSESGSTETLAGSRAVRRLVSLLRRFKGSLTIFTILGLLSMPGKDASRAQDAKPAGDALPPIGAVVTVTNPIDISVEGRIRRVGTGLQARAVQEKRRAVLLLEMTDGPSRFGEIRELADFLSRDVPNVTTVAWVPSDVRGYNAILALACNEIVMSPKASLGDVGRGKPVPADVQSFVVNMINRRHNPKLHTGLALGMMDPQKTVVWVRRPVGTPPNQVQEVEVLTQESFNDLLQSKVEITDRRTIKEAGTDGMFTAAQARALNYLVAQTAESRAEVATLYQISQREDPTAGDAPNARLIKVEGVIDPALEDFLRRQVRRGVGSGANLLVFEIDSPGGYYHSARLIAELISELDPKQVRTVAYIPREAISGGAMVALACDEIYMRPGAKMGDIGPLDIRAGGAFERAPEKILSALLADMTVLAQRKQRPKALLHSMANRELVVYEVRHAQTGDKSFMSEDEILSAEGLWIKGRPVPESAPNLLTVDGRRANELRLAEPPVENFDELKQRLGIPGDVELVPAGENWVDSLVYMLNRPAMRGLLFFLGGFCFFLELHVTTGFFGILAAVCFSLFFWGQFAEGNATWLEIILFVLGLLFLSIEILLLPGFGVFGISGGLLVVTSLVLASQTFFIPVTRADYNQLAYSMGTLSGAICACFVAAVLVGKLLPQTSLFNRMVLVPPGEMLVEPQLRPELTESAAGTLLDRSLRLLGRRGATASVLRPSGKALIDDQLLDVVSEGPFIERGTPIEVVEVSGNRIVVRQVHS